MDSALHFLVVGPFRGWREISLNTFNSPLINRNIYSPTIGPLLDDLVQPVGPLHRLSSPAAAGYCVEGVAHSEEGDPQ